MLRRAPPYTTYEPSPQPHHVHVTAWTRRPRHATARAFCPGRGAVRVEPGPPIPPCSHVRPRRPGAPPRRKAARAPPHARPRPRRQGPRPPPRSPAPPALVRPSKPGPLPPRPRPTIRPDAAATRRPGQAPHRRKWAASQSVVWRSVTARVRARGQLLPAPALGRLWIRAGPCCGHAARERRALLKRHWGAGCWSRGCWAGGRDGVVGGTVWTGGRGGAPRASARPDDVRASVCALRACALAAGPLPGARWESLLWGDGCALVRSGSW